MYNDGLLLGNGESVQVMKQHEFLTPGLDSNSSKKLTLSSAELSITEGFKGLKTHLDMGITSFGNIFEHDKRNVWEGRKLVLVTTVIQSKEEGLKDPSVSNREYFDRVMC